MKYVTVIILILFFSCNCTKEINKSNCTTKELAIQRTNYLLKNKNIDLNKLDFKVKDEGDKFKIVYSMKDSLSIGFGAEIIINKKDCNIISIKFYQ